MELKEYQELLEDIPKEKIVKLLHEIKFLRSCDNCNNFIYDENDLYCDELEHSFISVNDSCKPDNFCCNQWR